MTALNVAAKTLHPQETSKAEDSTKVSGLFVAAS